MPRLHVFAAICATLALAGTAMAAELTVTVTGVKKLDTPSSVRIALYDNAKNFRHEESAMQILSVPATPGEISVVFHDIPPGRYAVLAYHDENNNKKLDLFLGMFPSEGWGLSNDPSVFGPPKFEDSAFDVAEQGGQLTLPLHY